MKIITSFLIGLVLAVSAFAQTQAVISPGAGNFMLDDQYDATGMWIKTWFAPNTITFDLMRVTDSTNSGAPLNAYMDNHFIVDRVGGVATFKLVEANINYNNLANLPTAMPIPNFEIYAAGTAYTITASSAAVAFGTTSPNFTLPSTGTWLITTTAQVRQVAATYIGGTTLTMKLRRTSGTPVDLSNSATTSQISPITLLSSTMAPPPIPSVVYSGNSGDVITIFAQLGATPTVGSIQVTEASLVAIRVQ